MALLGDKLVLFLLGAREVDIRDTGTLSFVANYSCSNAVKRLKLYHFHHDSLTVCFLGSFFGVKSLVMSDKILQSPKKEYILEKVLTEKTVKRSFIDDYVIMLSYLLLSPGYFVADFSIILKEVFFYMLSPLVSLKSILSVEAADIDGVFKFKRSKFSREKSKSLIVKDIINDFSAIKEENHFFNSLWNKE